MGYRSEVYIAVPKKAEEEMDKVMKHYYDDEDWWVDSPFKKYDHTQKWVESDGNHTISKEETFVIYEGSFLKWYEGYKDVVAIIGIAEKYSEDGACIVCVGEDGQIHGELGDYHEVFNVYTKVELI